MASVDESLQAASPLRADLRAGVESISQNQDVIFTKYVKLILPLDGFVFWVKADLVSQGAVFNAGKFNGFSLNQAQKVLEAAPYISAQGSLHYSTELRQDETHTYSVNRVVFTSEQEVQDLNEVGETVIYIGTFNGVRFAFSNRGLFYKQADLYHYVGSAVYSDMETQIVDSINGFSRKLVVSNSLPAWLALNGYAPSYGFGNQIPLYPSYLVPQNITPPYASVHVLPESTRALTGAPKLGPDLTHTQLTAERVRVTMFGVRNDQALDFVDCVNQYSLDTDVIGIMNQPTVRDDKRTQVELGILSQKKTIEFEVSYYQQRINDVARQVILSAIPTFYIGDAVAA